MLRFAFRHLFWAGVGLVALWGIGQVFRDARWITALCFYVPSPLVFALLLAAGVVCWRVTGRLRQPMVLCLLALLPLTMILTVENHWTKPPLSLGADEGLRLVHWNVYRGQRGWKQIEQQLQHLDADVVALSELPHELDFAAAVRRLGTGYRGLRFGEMAVIARGRVTELRHEENGAAAASLVEIEVNRRRLTLLIADLPSSILVVRDPLLRWLCRLMSRDRPDLVVGDWNAPRRSRALSPLPAGYAHAYDQAGSGWSYTWPTPVPLWAIDQCIVGARIETTRYELRTLPGSDHRLQWLEFRERDGIGELGSRGVGVLGTTGGGAVSVVCVGLKSQAIGATE